jgi:starch synthase
VLLASAELAPLTEVGGLGEAVAGLARALQAEGVDVEVVVPDYGRGHAADGSGRSLDVPSWTAPATARQAPAGSVGQVTLVEVPGMARPHPYVDERGTGWSDNDRRFLGFSAAVAALARCRPPDVLHLNDWHTGATIAFLPERVPTVLTIHSLGHHGTTSGRWLARLPHHAAAYEWYGGVNPLSGAIALADRIVTVSPTYAEEILRPESGMGLHDQLAVRAAGLVGIRNGIDTEVWDPRVDRLLPATYAEPDAAGRAACRSALLTRLGWDPADPLIGMVTRLVDQKGVDLALSAVPYLDRLPARLAILGSGDAGLAAAATAAATARPARVAFVDGYDVELAHQIFAGADLFLMPSRFEPCGLTQMQAMAYGTIPVVTDVGGLHDTVTDADLDRGRGTGFVAATVDTAGIVDALHRAVRAWRHPTRRRAIQERGMATDWSWRTPAREHVALYEGLLKSPPLTA